jgi:hypothetical protein
MTSKPSAAIQRLTVRDHAKASERYVDVIFSFPGGRSLNTSVPIQYRRTATDIADDEIDGYLQQVFDEVNPSNWAKWRAEQESFWQSKPRAAVTKPFFDVLATSFDWCCTQCTLPRNSNFARRIQDIKEFGFTLATNPKRHCSVCSQRTTHIILLPIKRGGITGYEMFSATLRNRIIRELRSHDVFEAKVIRNGLLPDHKFPEIRWDMTTRRESLEDLSDAELRRDFQLLSNQRNQQKREVCRTCFQTGVRGVVFGIPFFYSGTETWDESIPKTGKNAEAGCIGCGWYDLETWRKELIKRVTQS